MHGPRPTRLQTALPTGLPDAGLSRARNVRLPDMVPHKIKTAAWTAGKGFVYRTMCGVELTARNGAMRTTYDVACPHDGCAPRVPSC